MLWDSVSKFQKGEKSKPPTSHPRESHSYRVIDGQYPSNSELSLYFSLHEFKGGSPTAPWDAGVGGGLSPFWVRVAFCDLWSIGYWDVRNESDGDGVPVCVKVVFSVNSFKEVLEMGCLPCSVSPPHSLSRHSERAQRMSMKDRSFCSKGHHEFILLCCL